MKKILAIAAVLLASLNLSGCENVHSGYVAVKVDKFGDSRGVQTEVVGPGRYLAGFNTDYFEFPEFTKNDTWTKSPHEGSPNDESITFQTKEGTSINADFGIAFHIERVNIAKVFTKYRRGIDEISDVYLRNIVRDTLVEIASTKSLDDLMEKKGEFLKEANVEVIKRAALSGISVESISAIGDFRWPESVRAAMNAKMVATQQAMRVENELRTTEAEQKKKIVEADAQVKIAEAESKATAMRGEALAKNPAVLKQMWIEKWDGKLPATVAGSDNGVMLNLNK
jgi:regulator of protease activity HflC (stomatin/prohibitin superfamily)